MQRPEQDIQRGIVQFIKLQYPNACVFHVPNGCNIGPRVGAIYKGMGLKAGVSDICILWRGGKAGFLEVKSATGRLTTHQESFGRRCGELGIPWACIRSIDDAKAALTAWAVR